MAIFFDGEAYLTKVPSVYIIEQLVTLGKIPPINAVFIDNASRSSRGTELPPNKAFATFMAKELMPWLNTMGIKPAPIDTILTGSSYGGLASTYVAFTYPNTFKKVLSQSGSFWWSPRRGSTEDKEPQWLTREIARADKADIHLYFNAGLFETGYFTIDILESNRHLRDVLTAKGYVYTYHEFSGGHDYYAWRYELARGLIKLLNNQ